MRVVVVEDNESLAKGIAYRLRDAGHAVDLLHDGRDAEAFLANEPSDALILDINLPGLDGLSLLRTLRARGDARPVILLTARAETEDRVTGLDAGADDYLVKPFEMSELEARLRAVTRRRADAAFEPIRLGGLSFDPLSRQITAGETPFDLPRREMAVFEALLDAAGRTLPKTVLIDQVYGAGSDVEESAIEVHISRLRGRLKPHGVAIRVQRGLGYQMLAADVP